MKMEEEAEMLPGAPTTPGVLLSDSPSVLGRHLVWIRSSVWPCLLLALVVRVWLIIHTNGFVDADEALVGVQAQHIILGERPIYYYGQPYMGSLEAYLMAGVFALLGSSVWTLRVVPVLLSLGLVWLSWHLAGELADHAKLLPSLRPWMMLAAGLLAACPPLYDLVIELRTWGGHIETYLLMVGMLYAMLRLTRRWDEGAGRRELVWRWAGLGLMIGVGLWIYPLIACGILALMVWIGMFLAGKLFPLLHTLAWREVLNYHWRKLRLAIYALPAGLLGFSPGLYWGLQNGWANISYLLAPGSDGGNTSSFLHQHPDRLALLGGTLQLYGRCLVPEVFGGSLPSQPLTASSPYSFGFLTMIGVATLLIMTGLVGVSFWVRHPLLVMARCLAALPLLFAWCTIFIFCFSSAVGGSIFEPCTRDGVGRYAAPILLAFPLIGSALGMVAYGYLVQRGKRRAIYSFVKWWGLTGLRTILAGRMLKRALPFVVLVCILGTTVNTYIKSDSGYVFQSFACLYAPANDQEIIDYMRSHHIRYVWGSIALGNSILFKTGGAIIVADPRIITSKALNRLPQDVEAVAAADRASLLDIVPRNDRYPQTLQALDQANILYRVARFPSQPGAYDVLLITPLNRTLLPSEAVSYGSWELRC